MEITLRNGEVINLDWNPLILEYLEDYEGGIEQLKIDIQNKKQNFRTFNFMLYCVVSVAYPEELTYKEAVSLVDINDIERITTFIVEHVNNMKLSNSGQQDAKKSKHKQITTDVKPHRR